ncbi:MAG: sulfotransferase, partial [Xanthomonadales bacterium]|nr:sulfotransferase [Xanthomonadales bacterium]
AHPAVTAASELPWIPRLIAEESRRRGAGIADWAASADASEWRRMGEAYLRHTQWWQQGEVFTDKLPGNHAYIGAILAMLPDALVISLHRDARDVCFSCYRQLFVRGLEFSYDLEDLAAYWQDFERVTADWEQRAPERVLRVDYERLVDDLETEARRIVEFIGLDWDPACLRFFEAERAVNTASAAQVREGVSRRGIGHWKQYEAHLGPLLTALEDDPPDDSLA